MKMNSTGDLLNFFFFFGELQYVLFLYQFLIEFGIELNAIEFESEIGIIFWSLDNQQQRFFFFFFFFESKNFVLFHPFI